MALTAVNAIVKASRSRRRSRFAMPRLASLLVLAVVSTAALQLPHAPASSARRSSPPLLSEGMVNDRIEKMIADNKVSSRYRCATHPIIRRRRRSPDRSHPTQVMLFMKGDKVLPQCGFSNTAVMILKAVTESAGSNFETFDVLSDNDVRGARALVPRWSASLEPSQALSLTGRLPPYAVRPGLVLRRSARASRRTPTGRRSLSATSTASL